MKMLVTGRQGQLATALAQLRADGAEIVCLGRPELDIVDRVAIDRAIDLVRPDIVVNAAAYTAVDRAETEAEIAHAVNAAGAGKVAAAARAAGLPIIHISTDYVYSGAAKSPYREGDRADPINVYGRSKLAGDEAVAAENAAHMILRTGWVYAPWGSNFARTMMRLAAERDAVNVVHDQTGTPNNAVDLAEAIVRLARVILNEPEAEGWRGVSHLAASGQTSWAGFAERLFETSRALGGPYATVNRIGSADYPMIAARPHFTVLATDRLRRLCDLALPDWKVGADDFVAAYLSK